MDITGASVNNISRRFTRIIRDIPFYSVLKRSNQLITVLSTIQIDRGRLDADGWQVGYRRVDEFDGWVESCTPSKSPTVSHSLQAFTERVQQFSNPFRTSTSGQIVEKKLTFNFVSWCKCKCATHLLSPSHRGGACIWVDFLLWHIPEGVAEHSFLGCKHQSTCMIIYFRKKTSQIKQKSDS